MGLNLGVFGATGQVGSVMLEILSERNFPISTLRLFASDRSKGKKVKFLEDDIEVESVSDLNFKGLDIALLSIGAQASLEFSPILASQGIVVIDNSSAFRGDPDVPLVVSDVNPEDLLDLKKNIVSNPNCTTMIAMPPLKVLHDLWGLKGFIATTFQAASGAGRGGLDEIITQAKKDVDRLRSLGFHPEIADDELAEIFPAHIHLNVVPVAGSFSEGDSETSEEKKLRNESRKILHISDLLVSSTCVRVGVVSGHSLSISAMFETKPDISKAIEAISKKDGIVYKSIPNPIFATGRDPVYVGRVKENTALPHAIDFFVSGDNLRKGAALNAVQIAELILKMKN